MRAIAHISDLHFGKIDPPVAEGLVADLQRREPTLLVVSGDFTQRAEPSQFEEAAAYLRRLPRPQIVVPGNHDVPWWGLIRRMFFPLVRYEQFITTDFFPSYQDEELFVLGVNTARSFTRTSGWLDKAQLLEIEKRVAKVPPGIFKVLVTHHPFIPAPRKPNADIVVGASPTLQRFESLGIDMLLAGHLHMAYHDDVRAHHEAAERSVLSVQAGTATSTRRRGEPNAYNWITISDDLATVAVRAWNGHAFEESLVTRYERHNHEWRAAAQTPVNETASATLNMPQPPMTPEIRP
jgi:3',5'-cyclic AMP phosphodiesterase CpdA